jgi:hypothetical protein
MDRENLPKKELIHDLNSKGPGTSYPKKSSGVKSLVFTIIIVLILGIGTGYIASGLFQNAKKGPLSINGSSTSQDIKKGFTAGVSDTSAFPDTAEGTLKKGGINGEGQYHLERPGGESQNVYMSSSVVDLSQFIDKKIKVWGATQTAQSAGWLMDVGKIEVE